MPKQDHFVSNITLFIKKILSFNNNILQKTTENGSPKNPFAYLDTILYPPIASPRVTSTLSVSPLHNITYYEYGNPEGEPALFLHGGPGAGCFPNHARFFDPSHYRIILMDQRGCGNSSPRGEVRENTLKDLVEDCERIRTHLSIDKWKVVLGGSWGTTLAIGYAQEYPTMVGGLVLRGVCLLRPAEVDWLFGDNGGASRLNPDGWKDFASFVTEDPKKFSFDDSGLTVLHSYYNQLLSSNPSVRLEAARNWSGWERNMSSFVIANETSLLCQDSSNNSESTNPHMLVWDGQRWTYRDESDELNEENVTSKLVDASEAAQRFRKLNIFQSSKKENVKRLHKPREVDVQKTPLNLPKNESLPIPVQNMLTCYYSVNCSPNNEVFGMELLNADRMSTIKSIPCIAIHGGQDIICPTDNVLDFMQNHPNPENMFVRIPLGAGHSMYNPAIAKEIVRATEWFKTV